MTSEPTRVDIDELLSRHEVILFDAYGVLLAAEGALPGAIDLVARLEREGRPYFVVTNDASRHPSRITRFYASLGLPIPEERVLSSGALLARHFEEARLRGARCVVLGPEDSQRLVREAGGVITPLDAADPVDAVVVCDEAGYPLLETLDEVISRAFFEIDRGRELAFILPNPDMLYPKGDSRFGVAAGSVALVIEHALERRYRERAPAFTRLGKPEAALFDEARRRAGSDDLVMLGDQLDTDVKGANGARVASALVETGLARWRESLPPDLTPTYLLSSLVVGGSRRV